MKKYKWFADVTKEESWLNEQLAQGYACERIGAFGSYTFAPTDRKMVIRLDYQDYMTAERFAEYVSMHEDFGWTHLRGHRWGSVQYWQKPADARDDLFSDAASQAAFYRRLMNYALSMSVLFFLFSMNVFDGNPFDVKGSYLTQGLWEMEGALFWKAFLFETPFALMRFLAPWVLVVSFALFLYSYSRYSKHKKQYD